MLLTYAYGRASREPGIVVDAPATYNPSAECRREERRSTLANTHSRDVTRVIGASEPIFREMQIRAKIAGEATLFEKAEARGTRRARAKNTRRLRKSYPETTGRNLAPLPTPTDSGDTLAHIAYLRNYSPPFRLPSPSFRSPHHLAVPSLLLWLCSIWRRHVRRITSSLSSLTLFDES